MRDYAYPKIGDKRVDWITSTDIMAVLLPIWNTKPPTAQRVRQRIGTVMKWAIAQGYRMDNPAGETLGAALNQDRGVNPGDTRLSGGVLLELRRRSTKAGA